MPIIHDMHELYEMEATHHFEVIFSTLNLNPICTLLYKPKKVSALVELNYGAMVYSLIVRVVERIVTIKDLVKRLKRGPIFRYDCGFLHSDQISSESSYSRMIATISKSNAMAQIHDQLLLLAINGGHLSEENIAIDVTHFEARERAKASEKKEKPAPKNVDVSLKLNVNNG